MLTVNYSSAFKRDLKRIEKQHLDTDILKSVIKELINKSALDPNFQDHALKGKWNGFRECHLDFDWLLIYYCTETTLYLVRTGTHQDLFGN